MTAVLTAKAGKWFAENGLKFVAYGLLGITITIGSLVYYGYQRRNALKNDVATLTASVQTLVNANKTNQETIARMQADSVLDDAVIAALDDKLKEIDNQDEAQTKRIRTLEANNAEVRAWLRTRTPAGIGCVLDDSCEGGNPNSAPSTKQKPAATVR